jgi:hypothetical protein
MAVTDSHFLMLGRSTRIRTLDPLVPNQVRYRTAPHSEEAEYYRLFSFRSINHSDPKQFTKSQMYNAFQDIRRHAGDESNFSGGQCSNRRRIV